MRVAVDQYKGTGYFGGKEAPGTYQTIINQIRPHDIFISLFLGHCAITRHIKKARHVIGVEKSIKTIDAWTKMQFDWVQLVYGDGIAFIDEIIRMSQRHPDKRICVYADPPYRKESRKSHADVYDCEMTDQQHEEFLAKINVLALYDNIDVLVSHYPDPVYKRELSNWQRIEFESTTRHGKATEHLYMNYTNDEGLLHDYQFVGANKDERYNLKHRTAKNLIKKLERMPAKKRQAVLYYMREWLAEES